jgi:hypothetical protein
MNKPSNSEIYEQAIRIIDRIQLIGLPTTKNISELENLITQLQQLSLNFDRAVHLNSMKLLNEIMERIKKKLEHEKEIPIWMYKMLNIRLIVFKENLIAPD